MCTRSSLFRSLVPWMCYLLEFVLLLRWWRRRLTLFFFPPQLYSSFTFSIRFHSLVVFSDRRDAVFVLFVFPFRSIEMANLHCSGWFADEWCAHAKYLLIELATFWETHRWKNNRKYCSQFYKFWMLFEYFHVFRLW